jgi:hypothetical protein
MINFESNTGNPFKRALSMSFIASWYDVSRCHIRGSITSIMNDGWVVVVPLCLVAAPTSKLSCAVQYVERRGTRGIEIDGNKCS